MRITSSDILATMRYGSIPNETYFVLEFDPDYACYKDEQGYFFEIINCCDAVCPVQPIQDFSDRLVYIVSEETAMSIKSDYLDSDYFNDCSWDDPFEDVYNETCEQLYNEGNY